ncbi:formate/nitrite transporter family protein [Halopelagius longus]|uniref:Formate/nitrite transporter FocA, FNT family n=1 Tax=Halopelagius longus TaxID=1236180 RepID=A0A1H0Y5S5_9EURY|nr:formate/nitrite transporter family protein [Halopelagius longus]RDI72294.1 formate/nitrite transporter family protein [Halopelagius longus]SDQ10514.1 Formate/nitrite transporter FocA, FNT family [Halopelagius longus]
MSTSDEGEPSGASLSYSNILEREMENALKELDRPTKGLFLSGLAAGMNLSFGALFMGMVLTYSLSFPSTLVKQFLLAAASSVAFLFVVLGQTELYTAHTTLAVLPVLDGRTSMRELGRLWSVVYIANLVGCAVFAGLIAVLGPEMGIVAPAAFESLANALLAHPWWVILLSGVVAGWLMGTVTWLVAASRDTIGRVAVTLIVTAAIGFGPFHHAILGTTEVLGAMFLGTGVTLGQFGHFILWTTVGNTLGGGVFVAGLNYGHAALAGEEKDVEIDPGAETGDD